MPSRCLFLLWLLVTGVLRAQDPSKQLCVFEGTVRDSVTRQPIPKATLHLTSDDNHVDSEGVTDAAGAFRFEAVPPGRYKVAVTHRGYSDETFAPVNLAAGQTLSNAAFALDAEAIVSGRVQDSGGDPVSDAAVYAIAERWQRGVRTYEPAAHATTDDRGQFRLKVAAGTYYLSAQPLSGPVTPNRFTTDPGKPELRIATAYYPNAASLEAAAPVRLTPGRQLDGVDLVLPVVPAYHVRGVVKPYAPQPQAGALVLWNRSGDRTNHSQPGARIAPDGSFDIPAVEPGSYWLELLPFAGSPSGRMALEVVDRDVTGVTLAGTMPFDLAVHLRFDGADGQPLPPPHALQLEMLDWRLFRTTPSATVESDGTIVFSGLRSGQWVLTLAPDRDAYIQSISCGAHELAAGIMDFTNGPCGDLEIVLAGGTGEVQGSMRWPDPPWIGGPVSALLVAASGQTGNTGARRAPIDENGQFHFRFVPPGRYLVFAVAVASAPNDDGVWQNADFVKEVSGRGVAADVPSKGSVRVEVGILPADDIGHAIERIHR